LLSPQSQQNFSLHSMISEKSLVNHPRSLHHKIHSSRSSFRLANLFIIPRPSVELQLPRLCLRRQLHPFAVNLTHFPTYPASHILSACCSRNRSTRQILVHRSRWPAHRGDLHRRRECKHLWLRWLTRQTESKLKENKLQVRSRFAIRRASSRKVLTCQSHQWPDLSSSSTSDYHLDANFFLTAMCTFTR
jgi:hypothetical protein